MTKTVWTQFRMSETLAQKVNEAAQERGMNLSEFYRYALTIFFDYHTDSDLDHANHTIAEPRPTYETEPA